MTYRPSAAYLASRRRGPLRLAIVLAIVLALFAATIWLPGTGDGRSDRPWGPFSMTAALVAAVGLYQGRQLAKSAQALDGLQFQVLPAGILAETKSLQNLLKSEEVRRVVLYRRLLSERITHIGIVLAHGEFLVPELEQMESFVAELRAGLPSAPFEERRSLLR